jgi:hypothetical protein
LRSPTHRASTASARLHRKVTLALIGSGSVHSLVAVSDSGITEDPRDVLQAAELLTEHQCAPVTNPRAISGAIEHWVAERRGHEMARLATDQTSVAHAAVLRALQDRLRRAARFERKALGARIGKCRRRLLATRGIGAERALMELSQGNLDLDALEGVLESRALTGIERDELPRVIAALSVEEGALSAWVAERPEP